MRITYINKFDYTASTKEFEESEQGRIRAQAHWELLQQDRLCLAAVWHDTAEKKIKTLNITRDNV